MFERGGLVQSECRPTESRCRAGHEWRVPLHSGCDDDGGGRRLIKHPETKWGMQAGMGVGTRTEREQRCLVAGLGTTSLCRNLVWL